MYKQMIPASVYHSGEGVRSQWRSGRGPDPFGHGVAAVSEGLGDHRRGRFANAVARDGEGGQVPLEVTMLIAEVKRELAAGTR